MDWARDAVLAALLDRVPVGGPIEEETLLELAHAFGPELLLALDLVDTEQGRPGRGKVLAMQGTN